LLRRLILNRDATVVVLGQGYVGLSLACAVAEAGFSVTGLDVDAQRIADLRSGMLSVPGVGEDVFRAAWTTGNMSFTTDDRCIASADVIAICVPTPVRDHAPDMSFISEACMVVARRLEPGKLIILESTTYPGTTEEFVRPLLETSGLVAGRSFALAYSPERIDPGNTEYTFEGIPRVVGGISAESTGVAALFYGQLVDKVFTVSSCRAAELAKLLENTFRHVNVALINEMTMLCHEMGIGVWEVIDAAASKPFGFMPFYPGPGVGGHCIPLDPAYLAWQVRRDAGRQFRILEESQDINAQMPGYVAARVSDSLNDAGKPMKGSKVLILGIAYKPDVGDTRESPSLKVLTLLRKRGVAASFHDPFVDSISLNGDVLQRTDLTRRAVAGADLVAILTPHSAYDLEWVATHAKLVFDARNAFGDQVRENVVKL
jgi:nucleotide sugar dehydrogenase